ncbi:MAG: UDP-N-acetylmuramate--L-alanine ligase [Paludibacteraceae bacterium]|nr:UDP-N-acetylmuramate--L-alanine ligase [Paludibacteraceae bacterium]
MQTLFFLGIGGIGMSALARYAIHCGYRVYGYDRMRSQLCQRLETEGCVITYDDDASNIPTLNVDKCVFTPAIPNTNAIYRYFVDHGVPMVKRAEILGELTRDRRGLAVAGTHGKTTTSTMIAHLLRQSHIDTSAFLGGISINYDTNLLLANDNANANVVVEADEFDRSFHHLRPYMAVVTATDADHLDIYGTHQAYLEAFAHFTSLIQQGGVLLYKKGITLDVRTKQRVYTYSADDPTADFHAENIRVGNGRLLFDYVSPDFAIRDLSLGVPVRINVENAVAAMAIAQLNGVTPDELRNGIASFRGVRRRFEIKHDAPDFVHIDDYAHHPDELRRSIASVLELYSDRRLVVVFQPHLYTRTRDFFRQFASALSLADQVVLLDVYPARELPIPGITSQLILDNVTSKVRCLTTKENLATTLASVSYDVLLTLGAGDIGDIYFPCKT